LGKKKDDGWVCHDVQGRPFGTFCQGKSPTGNEDPGGTPWTRAGSGRPPGESRGHLGTIAMESPRRGTRPSRHLYIMWDTTVTGRSH
jgi:hypothetical protein